MLVYKETVEDRILQKDRDLSDEFWNQAAVYKTTYYKLSYQI